MSMWHAKLSFLLRLTPVMSLSNSHVWCLFKLSLLVKLLHSVYSTMTCRRLTHWVYLLHHTHVGFHQPHPIFRSWGNPRTWLNMYQFVLAPQNVVQTYLAQLEWVMPLAWWDTPRYVPDVGLAIPMTWSWPLPYAQSESGTQHTQKA